jgi:hypothetical protein
MIRKNLIATFALVALLGGGLSRAQAPANFELALVDIDGTKKVLRSKRATSKAPMAFDCGPRISRIPPDDGHSL